MAMGGQKLKTGGTLRVVFVAPRISNLVLVCSQSKGKPLKITLTLRTNILFFLAYKNSEEEKCLVLKRKAKIKFSKIKNLNYSSCSCQKRTNVKLRSFHPLSELQFQTYYTL